jgi:hypothetical protein
MVKETDQYRSPEFLEFAHGRGGLCCVCLAIDHVQQPRDEVHHYGPKGMGQRGSDLLVCRLCKKHHQHYQGKRTLGFLRAGEGEVLAAMRADNIVLLVAWVPEMERRLKR